MSHRKELKIYFILFISFMLGFATIAPLVFRWYFQHFNDNIHQKASLHIEVVRDLNDIETALYVYQKSFACYLQNSNDQCLFNMKEAKQKVLDRFTYLEDYNKNEFLANWIEVTDFEPDQVEKELRRMLSDYNSEKSTMKASDFQRLFYLVRSYSKTYFLESVQRLKQNLATVVAPDSSTAQDLSVENEQSRVDLLFLGFTELKDHYHSYFWNFSNSENKRFKDLTDRYQIIIVAGFAVTILFAILLGLRVLKLFTLEKQSKKEVLALGTRDKVTGLFNFSSLKILLAQEVARSLRSRQPISLLMIRIESFDEVEKVEGIGAAERLIFQVSETLKRFCRAYDRLYKYDAKSFLVVFPETPPKVLNKLVARFQSKISKKRFLINKGKTKLTPLTHIGAACFPVSGKTTEELLKACEQSLSKDFNTNQIFPQETLNKNNLFENIPLPASSGNTETSPPLTEQTVAATDAKTDPITPAPSLETSLPAAGIPAPEPTPSPEPQMVAAETEIVPEKKSPEILNPEPASEPVEEDIPDVVMALSQEDSSLEGKSENDNAQQDTVLTASAATETGIQIVHNNNEDIIMVDFDREKKDIADKFRRKNHLNS